MTLCYKEERKWGGKGGEGGRAGHGGGRTSVTLEEVSWWQNVDKAPPPTTNPRPVPSLSDTAHPLDFSILIHIQPCLQLGAMFCLLFSEYLDIVSVLKSPCCLPRRGSSRGKPPPSFLLGLHTGYTGNHKALFLVAKPFPSHVWVFNCPPQAFLVSLNWGSVLPSAARENKRGTHFRSYSSIPPLPTSGTKQVFRTQAGG